MGLGPANQSVRQATPKGDYDVMLRFNSNGFRDTKDLRTAQTNDWFAVGDSFMAGWGVEEEERLSNVFEKRLFESGNTTRVFNIAIPDNFIGYQRLVRYAEEKGARIRRMLVGVCMENDLRNYSDGKSAWDVPGKSALRRVSTKERLRGWIRGHSALYNSLSFTLQRWPAARKFFERIGVARNVDQLSGRNDWDEAALKSSRDELVKLVHGREAWILIIPARRLWHGDNIATEEKVHDAFLRLLQESNLRVVDMRPVLEKGGRPLSYYFITDPHWNARGHALAADELFAAISQHHGTNVTK